MIRVLIADDHPLIRKGIRQLLAEQSGFAPPGEATDIDEALQQIEEQPWDVVVLDISMPGRSGLDALPEIRRRRPNLPVLILSVYSEELFAIRALRAGAQGYLTKNNAPDELVSAIRKVHSGKKYISSSVAETLASVVESGVPRPPHEALSDREFQVMCQIAQGKSVSEIAADVSLSVKTISTYRSRALEKLKMRTNAEFTRYALQNHLVN